MANLIIVELDNSLITPSLENNIKSISKFYECFKNKTIIILYESNLLSMNDIYQLMGVVNIDNVVIDMYLLNNFARNRLINNLEDDRPELTLTIMGCSESSKLIKIWKKNVKR